MPPTGEANATAWPSGDSLTLFIGLFHWLICVIFAGPLGALERGQKRYAASLATSSATQTARIAYFFSASLPNGCTSAELVRCSLASSATAPLDALTSPLLAPSPF